MAKLESFDIVSKVNLQEVQNAVDQTRREVAQRYDFKGSPATVEWDGKGEITLVAENDFRLEALVEILKMKMTRRGVAVRSLEFGKPTPASGGQVRQVVKVVQGISKEKAKEIVAAIKELKLKVQPQIMEDQIRVQGKSRDELQAVIQALKQRDFGVELQFTNYR